MPYFHVQLRRDTTTLTRIVLAYDESDAITEFCIELNLTDNELDELLTLFDLEITNVQY